MTVNELQERLTMEELVLWSSYFALEAKEQQALERRKAQRRR